MLKEFKSNLFMFELLTFSIVQVLGIYVGYILISAGLAEYIPTEEAIPAFVIAFAIATGLILLFLKYVKTVRFFTVLFAFLIFIGSDVVFGSFFGEPLGLILALSVVIAMFYIRNVLTHNIGLTLAIAGIGAQLGITLTLPTIIVLLVMLSIYDVFAVFKSKHMIKMFRGLLEKGAAMAIIVPDNPKSFVKKFEHVKTEKLKEKKRKRKQHFLMLGTGDIAFPVIFAVSALQISVISSILVVFGAISGLFLTHYLIMVKKIKALPALPPIALGCLIGFGLSLI